MKHLIFLIALCCWSVQSIAQNINLNISPVFGSEPITEGKWFVTANGDSLQFDNLRFYLSAIQFDLDNGQTITDVAPAHLIDVFEPSTLTIALKNSTNTQVKKLRFNIGIDSTTSVSGALGGDLDPTKGMYWAWQSGYINMKIEGRSPASQTRKNVFQFHLGGYMQPFYAMRRVELVLKQPVVFARNEATEGVVLKIDVSKFFKDVHLATQNSIMMPSKEAMLLADLSVQMFSIHAQEK